MLPFFPATTGKLGCSRRDLLAALVLYGSSKGACADDGELTLFVPEFSGSVLGNTASQLRSAAAKAKLYHSLEVMFFEGTPNAQTIRQFSSRFAGRNDMLLVAGSSLLTTLVREGAERELQALTPVGRILSEPAIVTSPVTSALLTFGDVLARLEKDSKPLSVALNELGSFEHLVLNRFLKIAGRDATRIEVVAAGSGGALLASAITGGADIAIGMVSALGGAVRQGSLRGLGVSRASGLTNPPIPAMAETMQQPFDESAWIGLFAPPGVAGQALVAHQQRIEAFVTGPVWRNLMVETGAMPEYLHPALMPTMLKLAIEKARADLLDLKLL
jgi:tripartite-type tricarboxylate transporter receptor subunit TctC